MMQMWLDTDIRAVLPTVRVPTLVLTRSDTLYGRSQVARWVADQIEGARFSEVPGRDLASWVGHTDALIDEVEGFVTGVKGGTSSERVLATVLFTDLVGSTERAAELGDSRWKELLASHQTMVRAELAKHRGREIDTAGDGFFAIFDGPRGRSGARKPRSTPCGRWVSRSEPESTRARLRSREATCEVSPSTSERAWRRRPDRTRSWSPRRSGIWSPAADSGSKMTGSTISRACPSVGVSTEWLAKQPDRARHRGRRSPNGTTYANLLR